MNNSIFTDNSLGNPVIRFLGSIIGAGAFCLYSQSWPDLWKLVYDIISGLVVYSFLAQLLAEALAGKIDRWWSIRIIAVIAMTIFVLGREFLLWPISGHICTVISVTIIQKKDKRISQCLKPAYILALLIVILIRILSIDHGKISLPFLFAVFVGTLIGFMTIAIFKNLLKTEGKSK